MSEKAEQTGLCRRDTGMGLLTKEAVVRYFSHKEDRLVDPE